MRLSLVLWSPMDAATAREAAEALAPRLAPGCVLVVGGVVNVPWEERFAREALWPQWSLFPGLQGCHKIDHVGTKITT